jgi:hypothetical protein
MLEVMLMALGTEQVTLGTMHKSEIRVAEPEPETVGTVFGIRFQFRVQG